MDIPTVIDLAMRCILFAGWAEVNFRWGTQVNTRYYLILQNTQDYFIYPGYSQFHPLL